jgi:C-terminal processing protease CtpA/Prc
MLVRERRSFHLSIGSFPIPRPILGSVARFICLPFHSRTALQAFFLTAGLAGGLMAQSTVDNPTQKKGAGTPQSSGIETTARGKNIRGYLGVYLGDLNNGRVRELGLTDLRGTIVGKVENGSPGERAGLRENDVILSFNEKIVQNRAQFYELLESAGPGGKISLRVFREGKAQSINLVLGERPRPIEDARDRLFGEVNALSALADEKQKQAADFKARGDEKGAAVLLEEERLLRKDASDRKTYIENELRAGTIQSSTLAPQPAAAPAYTRVRLGVTSVVLGAQLAQYFQVKGTGVLISEVKPGEPADRAGVRAGDCITMVDAKKISTPEELNNLQIGDDPTTASEVVLTIVRDQAEIKLKVKFDSR